MDGIHDMGGMHGFGTVPVDDDAQFHADWERVVFALVRAIRPQGIYNIDESRYGIERMAPADYLEATYFERWLASLERNLVEKGHLTEAEIEAANSRARDLEDPAELVPERRDPDLAERVRDAFDRPASFDRPDDEPRFAERDAVRVRNSHPDGHTRCPRYVRRTTGEIRTVHGNHVFPDANAHGEERDEPLYTVAFEADEVWGPDTENPDDTIHVDLWEPYLRPAEENDND
ncbi:nitrile hydratase subunit beta [Halobacteriales archaeon QS_1_68_17]|nr:MAG: nitrile hydratase subunit beta [Halobacteriales archaeon QS_1_68_17]